MPDVPTDCPQRDEHLSCKGDAQAFARTTSFNFAVAGVHTKWLKTSLRTRRPAVLFLKRRKGE
jgi:alpha-L-rhamnosidase